MNHLLAASIAALLLSTSARADAPAPPPHPEARPGVKEPHAPRGKPQAPATIAAKLAAGRATVTVKFHSAVTDASIEVHGLDGLVVTTAAVPLSGGRFARGESVTLDVAFTEGATPGQLAVSVTGDFAGARRNAMTTFATRLPAEPQSKAARGGITDSTGRRIKVMPAESR